MSQDSKQQILQPLSILRPKFRVSYKCDYVELYPLTTLEGGCSNLARHGQCRESLSQIPFHGLTTLQDLVFIEEAFERLLLDYDRVFSAMAVPACLWRRTGEIYKGNREFAELVGLDDYMLRAVSSGRHSTDLYVMADTSLQGSDMHL